MRHGILGIGHTTDNVESVQKGKQPVQEDFVLEKSIFNNIFEKDIRRVFVYKKAERLAKAIHLIAPAFVESASLRSRIDAIAVGLVDAAILPPGAARNALSRELLTLSSILSIARTSGVLSPMNADLISQEAHFLLQEIAAYEEPRLMLEDIPTLSSIAKSATRQESEQVRAMSSKPPLRAVRKEKTENSFKGHIKDTPEFAGGRLKDRTEAVIAIIKAKGSVSIKDISHMVRGVSEKTIQRELQALIEQGLVSKAGERRWSTYSLT